MPTYTVTHRTTYEYSDTISLSYNEAFVIPRPFALPTFKQTVLRSTVVVDPKARDQQERVDFFGNRALHFSMRVPHSRMEVLATSKVQVEPRPFDGSILNRPWELVRDRLQIDLNNEMLAARQFVLASPIVRSAGLRDYGLQSFGENRPIFAATHDLMQRIYQDFDYVPGTTTIATPLSEVAETKKGVCQDYAHFMIGVLRELGLAARYVSGFIETVPPEGEEKLEGSDASHAWVSVFIPPVGWVDFDPTNNKVPSDQHITLAWGRDYSDVTPLKGVLFSSGEQTLTVTVDMRRQTDPRFDPSAIQSSRRSGR